MVTRKYQDYPIDSEVFVENGREWVYVKSPKTNRRIKARWYTEKEYAQVAHKPASASEKQPTAHTYDQHKIFGFDNGYITIYRIDEYSDDVNDWFKAQPSCRYSTLLGWYTPSIESIPSDLPLAVTPCRLNWEDVCANDTTFAADNKVREAIDKVYYPTAKGNFFGTPGDKITKPMRATLISEVLYNTNYGRGRVYTFVTPNDEYLVWFTSTTTALIVDETYDLIFHIKDHKTYKGVNQTLINYCRYSIVE